MARSYKQLLTTVESIAEGYPECIPNLYVYGTWDERALVVESVTGISLQQAAQFTLEFVTRPSSSGEWHCRISLLVAQEYKHGFDDTCFEPEARDSKDAASAIKYAQLALSKQIRETRGTSPQGNYHVSEELDIPDRIRIVVYGALPSINLTVIPDSSPRDFTLRLSQELSGVDDAPNLIVIHCLDTKLYLEIIESFLEERPFFLPTVAIIVEQSLASVEHEFSILEDLFCQHLFCRSLFGRGRLR